MATRIILMLDGPWVGRELVVSRACHLVEGMELSRVTRAADGAVVPDEWEQVRYRVDHETATAVYEWPAVPRWGARRGVAWLGPLVLTWRGRS